MAAFTALLLAGVGRLAAHDQPPDDLTAWSPVTLRLEAAPASAPILCELVLAHWYELRFGPVAAGEALDISLLARVASGDVGILNDQAVPMRLERIACGPEGLSRDGWQALPIEPLRSGPASITLLCVSPADSIPACAYRP